MWVKLYWGGLADFGARYRLILGQAWAERHRMPVNLYRRGEADFLPAALAIQERPPSPLPRLTAALLLSFACLTLLWAVFGQMDIVVIAPGKLVPGGRSKSIQALDAAKVLAIPVQDGQAVTAGSLLLELDAGLARAEWARAHADWLAAGLQAARARALLDALEGGGPPAIQAGALPDEERAQAERHVAGQWAELQGKLRQLDATITRRTADIRATSEDIKRASLALPLLAQHRQDLASLAADGYVARHDLQEAERRLIEAEGELAIAQEKRKAGLADLEESKKEREVTLSSTRRAQLDQLAEARQKSDEAAQDMAKAEIKIAQARILAPIDGVVQQLALHTVGGVVQPAQQLMLIVPKEDGLEVEAMIENRDIGFVALGQRAEIKVEAFPYTKFGTVLAQVKTLSSDAINDEKKGPLFSVLLALPRPVLPIAGQDTPLKPGMAVEAEIRTGKRRVIEYFLAPLLQRGHESLRER
ncbi:MAG TPA: HlyD family type I secretion periplasmic adaptor subunit [Rhodospirillaceae bacterium]|nr:HlyD family type I secretion periplasmic adaptor subunit [Rhodospirillaceae bacterium]